MENNKQIKHLKYCTYIRTFLGLLIRLQFKQNYHKLCTENKRSENILTRLIIIRVFFHAY